MARLADKAAIITGAAGDIGKAAVSRFVSEGARVLAVDIDEAGLADALGDLEEARVSGMVADVTRSNDMAGAVDAALSYFGKLDIAVLNAGIEGEVAAIADYDEDVFDRVMAVNVRGVWLGLKHTMKAMAPAGCGSIVLTSSVAGVRGLKGISAYTASKHAVVGLMRTAALEAAEFGVRVNTVNPGPIETRMIDALVAGYYPGDPEARERHIAATPLGRYGTPDEVANMMLFLASDESSHCTGEMYMVSGGRTA